jgi:hypothetical protein
VNSPSEDSLCTRFVYYLDHDQSFVYTHVHDHNSVRELVRITAADSTAGKVSDKTKDQTDMMKLMTDMKKRLSDLQRDVNQLKNEKFRPRKLDNTPRFNYGRGQAHEQSYGRGRGYRQNFGRGQDNRQNGYRENPQKENSQTDKKSENVGRGQVSFDIYRLIL